MSFTSVNPLLSPPGRYFFSSPFDHLGGGGAGGVMMVSVLHKELEYEVEKLKYKKVGGSAAEDKKQIRTSTW